jgi:cell division protein FtsL
MIQVVKDVKIDAKPVRLGSPPATFLPSEASAEGQSAAWQTASSPHPVVDSQDGRRRLGAGLVGLLVLGVTLGATAHVAVHAKRIEVAISLGKEERAFRELTEQRRHLEIEIGMLKDPARIIAIARDKLGMRAPAPEDLRALSGREGSVGR